MTEKVSATSSPGDPVDSGTERSRLSFRSRVGTGPSVYTSGMTIEQRLKVTIRDVVSIHANENIALTATLIEDL